MQRIDTLTKAVDLHGAGKHGFKDGNLAGGIAPTDFNADWCNGMQEELLAIIEAAGLAPDGATLTQLRQGIDIMLRKQAGAVCAAGGTADALTGAFTPTVAALVDGMRVSVRAGAANATTTPTFAADATGAKTIVKGNNLPLVAGDISGAGHWLELVYDLALVKWVLQNPASGANLLPVFASSLAANGWQKLPSGLIVQWGLSSVIASGAVGTITLPVTYPTAHYAAFGSYTDGSLSTTNGVPFNTAAFSTSQLKIFNNGVGNGQYHYFSIGR
jgi:hypothetical protein